MAKTNSSIRNCRVTALVLGDPVSERSATWMEIGPRECGVMVMSETFARRRLPPQALAAMRAGACFYMCVDDIDEAAAHIPGRRIGHPVLSHGMQELCVETDAGVVVLAQPA